MAIRITENGVVNYENSPDVNRKLFPNLHICGKEIDELEEEINGKAPAVFTTTSGSIASFDDGADDMPLKSCVVSIEPIQEGEGDPSPENVRPISGRTGLTVSHSGSDTSDPAIISINWETEAGTVYGGSLDVVSGKLVVDRALINIASLQFSLYFNTYGDSFFAIISDKKIGDQTSICNRFKNLTNAFGLAGAGLTGVYCDHTSLPRVYFRPPDSNVTTLAEFNEWINNNTTNLCYLLAEPIEYQLTPQEIRTLLGENNIWSDAGDVSVDYPADTKTYIDDLSIKTVEVSGQTPTITAEENTRYICGEVTSLSFTPCEKGICDVRFTAASISTVLTLPSTLKLPDWFDPTSLEANVTYEINIVDGVYGAVMSWA